MKTMEKNVRRDSSRKKLEQIVARATKLFIKKGYAQSGMREIAKVTGVNSGNLYNFIQSKEDILCLVFDTFHKPDEDIFQKLGIYPIDDPAEQLRLAVHLSVEAVNKKKNEILLMYRESKALPKKYLKTMINKESEFISYFEDVLRKGVKKKVFNVKDPFFAANMIVYQLSILPLRGWNFEDRYTEKEIIDLTTEYILKAVLS